MQGLITANIKERAGRTIVCAMGISVGVFLVIMTLGLVRGLLRDRGARDGNLGFEILASEIGQQGLSLTSLPMTMPVSKAADIRKLPGVRGVAVVGQTLEMKGEGVLGIRQIDGVRFEEISQISNLHIIEGEPLPNHGNFIVVDSKYARGHKLRPGDHTQILDRDFTVSGIYYPETGARLMIPLSTLQEIANAPDLCSMLYISCLSSDAQDSVAVSISRQFPDLRLLHTRDLPELFASGYGSFNVFLRIVIWLSAAISTLIVTLTMYTSVTERTRQIGILKSLGASRAYIVSIFLREALGVGFLGLVCGIVISIGTRWLLVRQFEVKISLEGEAFIYAIVAGLIGTLAGALYPAIYAANQDPVEALSYE